MPSTNPLDALIDEIVERVIKRINIPKPAEDWMTPDQTAHRLQITVGTLEVWRHKGKGPPFHKLSRNLVRYRKADVDSFLTANPRTSTSAPVNKRKGKEAIHA